MTPSANMHSIWQSLIWKEWHEHKWKLLSVVVILLGVTSLVMPGEEHDKFGAAYVMLLLCTAPLAVFIGLGAAAGERSRGTLPFLQSLPAPLWRLGLVKLLFGLMTIVVPVIATVVSLYPWRRAFDLFGVDYQHETGTVPALFGSLYMDVAVICAGIGASFFLWSAAAGNNRKDEISAGAVALTVMLGWSVFVWITYVVIALRPTAGSVVEAPGDAFLSWWVAIALSVTPGGATFLVASGEFTRQQLILSGSITLAVHILLAVIYVRSFGRIADREIASPRNAVRDALRYDWLAPPRQSPFTAIAWKQFRESGPIIVAGVVLSMGITLVMYTFNGGGVPLSHMYTVVSASLGVATALVVGIGLVLNDLGPQLNNFWRSRPISPDLIFWTKFAVGFLIVVAGLYLPIAFFVVLGQEAGYDPDATLIVPALHLATFAAGVAMTALVRHAVYAAILSFASVYLGILAVSLTWLVAGFLGWVEIRPDWWEPSETAQVVAGLLVTLVVSTFVAWLIFRYDWGRKSRY